MRTALAFSVAVLGRACFLLLRLSWLPSSLPLLLRLPAHQAVEVSSETAAALALPPEQKIGTTQPFQACGAGAELAIIMNRLAPGSGASSPANPHAASYDTIEIDARFVMQARGTAGGEPGATAPGCGPEGLAGVVQGGGGGGGGGDNGWTVGAAPFVPPGGVGQGRDCVGGGRRHALQTLGPLG